MGAIIAAKVGFYPDQKGLKEYLKRLSRQNLPLAIYLEREDFAVKTLPMMKIYSSII